MIFGNTGVQAALADPDVDGFIRLNFTCPSLPDEAGHSARSGDDGIAPVQHWHAGLRLCSDRCGVRQAAAGCGLRRVCDGPLSSRKVDLVQPLAIGIHPHGRGKAAKGQLGFKLAWPPSAGRSGFHEATRSLAVTAASAMDA